MAKVIVFSKANCPYCERAKALLTHKQADFDVLRIDIDPANLAAMQERVPNARTVPQIFIGDLHVGGFDDMHALDQAGKLDALLNDA